MTLSDEILKLQTNLADSYTACNGKGATLPANQNFDNLPDCIDSIQASTPAVITSLTITPSTTQQTITAPSGTDGYNPITVNAVNSSIDPNIVAGNIKDGVSILGVTGNYTGGGGSQNIDGEVTFTIVDSLTYTNFKFSDNVTNLSKTLKGTSNTYRLFRNVASVDFNNVSIISGSCRYLFDGYSSNRMSAINVSNIEQIGVEGVTTDGLYQAFRYIGSININFAKLRHIIGHVGVGHQLNETFLYSSGATISFPALELYDVTSEGVTYPINAQFTSMLANSTDCIVHFPSNLQSTMSSWASVTNGFGGTNTTVLFDLPATT